MDDIDNLEDEDIDDQIEQMIMENGMLVHSLANLLVLKGILKREEIEAEMDKLTESMEQYEEGE